MCVCRLFNGVFCVVLVMSMLGCATPLTLEQQVDAAILNAARTGTGCANADDNVKRSEDVGPNGFNAMQSANLYGGAGLEYKECARTFGPSERRLHFLTLAMIADDMAAVRYVEARDDTLAEGAYATAHADLSEARNDLRYWNDSDRKLFSATARLMAHLPKDQ